MPDTSPYHSKFGVIPNNRAPDQRMNEHPSEETLKHLAIVEAQPEGGWSPWKVQRPHHWSPNRSEG